MQKYGDFLLNCTKISLTVLCWSSHQSTLGVDFKVESIGIAIQEKESEILHIARYLPSKLANEKKWEQLQMTLDNSNPKRNKAMKHKFVQGNDTLSYQM